MKRVIEITAKSQEEAQEMANRELIPGEKILGSEVLTAPTKGMFGIVGNPEYRVRFTIESAPPESEVQIMGTPVDCEPKDDEIDEPESEEAVSDDDYDEIEDRTEESHSRNDSREHVARKYSTELIGKNHPLYDQIIEIITKAAGTVGVTELTLTEKQEDDAWIIDAAGGNVSQLIGKHGKTLDSLQFIVNIVANKGRDAKVKIVLDAQGYRSQRHKGLIILANRMYRKVIDSGRPVELEPMSTVDRRTIHIALKDRSGIETFSRGIEPLRRVVINPKKPSHGSHRGPRDRGHNREQKESSTNNNRGKAVPMFMEEDGSNEN